MWIGAHAQAATVRIYAGPGASPMAVAHAHAALQEALDARYEIGEVDASTLQSDGWQADTALVVMPGGRDLPYLASLGAAGARRIRDYVHAGGAYLGLCAGGYFGAADIVFYPSDPNLVVLGKRPLGFYPGRCQGPVWPDFTYEGERSVRAAPVTAGLRLYHNGGGAFVGAEHDDNVEVLTRYTDGARDAAVVLCRVGRGAAVLTGVHPEFDAFRLTDAAYAPGVLQALRDSDAQRRDFWRDLLRRLGLRTR